MSIDIMWKKFRKESYLSVQSGADTELTKCACKGRTKLVLQIPIQKN